MRPRPAGLEEAGQGRRVLRRAVEQQEKEEEEEEEEERQEDAAGDAFAEAEEEDGWDEADDVCLSMDALLHMTRLGPLHCLLLHQVHACCAHHACGGSMLLGRAHA